jgi:hypothetical protein
MSTLPRRQGLSLFAQLVLLGAAACGDGQEPIRPETLIVHAGNNQNGPAGVALPSPLQVQLTGSDGLPFIGATVQWAVVTGGATVSPTTSTTDDTGVASTTLTLGSTLGTVVVTATVSGITPVSFNAVAIDVCAETAAYTVGATVDGTLASTDCRLTDGTYADQFTFTITESQSLRFTLTSTVLNPFLSLVDATDRPIAFNDDVSQANRNSSFRVFLAPGAYVIGAGGFGPSDLGAYQLTSLVATDDITGCEVFATWLMRGVQATQALTAEDCELEDTDGNVYYGDPYFIHLPQGANIVVTQTSTVIDTYLELYRVTSTGFEFVAVNDDESAGVTNSRLVPDPIALAGIYMLLPSSALPVETGAYTLAIQ